jgi:hypothetical protein
VNEQAKTTEPTTLDEVLKDVQTPTHKILAFSLYEQARQAASVGRELELTGTCDPNDLRLVLRRAAANQMASRLLFPTDGHPDEAAARDLLNNLWQAKGQVVQ